jgi:SAM-dependent methyltransferase
MKITNSLKSITNIYKNMSNFGKILLFIGLLLIIIVFFKDAAKQTNKEGFTQTDKFLFLEGNGVFDDFYASVYDYLVFNNMKNEYEVGRIINSTQPNETSIIADIGCGTGHHVANLAGKNLNVIGVDISPSMIREAKQKYPQYNFRVGDALDSGMFQYNSLTHVLCLYFTIYYFNDKRHFFDNCMDWLMPGGFLIVHLVNRETFDPILPPGNPLYIVSPQKYAKERITKTKITFNEFVYESNFDLDKNNDIATFDEKFKYNDGNVRKQQQKLYMEDTSTIVSIAQDCGFILHAKVDLVKCAYESQYLYVFLKPS